ENTTAPTTMVAKASTGSEASKSITAWEALFIHLISMLGLALALWMAHSVYSIDLISDPSGTLFQLWVMETPILVLLYSRYRQNPQQCSYLKAVGRGILALPVGALLNALGAIALGAPVGIQYLKKTINWSLMMSLLTTVPATSVFGSSWTNWQRVFANTRFIGSVDYMISIPAHGAVIGAWFGAWPMPLDWERPWQEWPICVSYGAIAWIPGWINCIIWICT
ncbi:Phosphatidylinositol-glycan biosynthesis class F protein, partial [Quillaja saponaria]